MKVVFLDIEANGYDKNLREAIQIGAVKCDYNTGELTYFNEYIKHRLFKKMSKHCMEVTGITDEVLSKKGKDILEVLNAFSEFAKDSVVISWDEFDYLQIKTESSRVGMKLMFKEEDKNISYYNFQKIYQLKNSIPTKPSLMKTLNQLGLKHNKIDVHSALTDSINLKLLFEATNSLVSIEKAEKFKKNIRIEDNGNIIYNKEIIMNVNEENNKIENLKQILMNSVIKVNEMNAQKIIPKLNKMNIWDEVYIKNY